MNKELQWGKPHVFQKYQGKWKDVADLTTYEVFSAFCGAAFRPVAFVRHLGTSGGIVRIRVMPRTLMNIPKNHVILSFLEGTQVYVYDRDGLEELAGDIKKQHGETFWGEYHSD